MTRNRQYLHHWGPSGHLMQQSVGHMAYNTWKGLSLCFTLFCLYTIKSVLAYPPCLKVHGILKLPFRMVLTWLRTGTSHTSAWLVGIVL